MAAALRLIAQRQVRAYPELNIVRAIRHDEDLLAGTVMAKKFKARLGAVLHAEEDTAVGRLATADAAGDHTRHVRRVRQGFKRLFGAAEDGVLFF